MRRAIYPGSFDPFHKGHAYIIEQAALLFDEVTVAVAENSEKKHMFDAEKRAWLIRKHYYSDQKVITVITTSDLITNVMKAKDIRYMVRGVRNARDFEEESRLSNCYKSQHTFMETVLLMAPVHLDYVSSSLVKEIAKHKGKWKQWVPDHVADALEKRF